MLTPQIRLLHWNKRIQGKIKSYIRVKFTQRATRALSEHFTSHHPRHAQPATHLWSRYSRPHARGPNISTERLYITRRAEWAAAKNLGSYRGNNLDAEGLIHCSTLSQVVGSANRFFQGQQDLVILVIDESLVQPEVKYEGDADNLFPHIYGALNIETVVRSIDFEAGADGIFSLPTELK